MQNAKCKMQNAKMQNSKCKDVAMKRRTRLTVACLGVLVVASLTVQAQNAPPKEQYTIKVMPPGGPPPRLADGHPDFSGHWLPNSAGQGVSGRFGGDPEARRQFA